MRLLPKRDGQPAYVRSKINTNMINYKTYRFSKPAFLLYFLLFFAAGGAVGLVFYMNLFMRNGVATLATHISNAVVFVVFGLLSVRLFMPIRRRSLFEKRSTTQFGADSMIAQEAYVLVQGMDNGFTIVELLQDFAERSASDDIVSFVNVFETCYRTGGDMKAVIRNTYDMIGDKQTITEEIKTKLTSNKMQLNVMSVMPIVIVAFLRFSSSQFAETFASPQGVMLITAALALFAGAYLYGKKLVNVKG